MAEKLTWLWEPVLATVVSSQTWQGVGQGEQIPFSPAKIFNHHLSSHPTLGSTIRWLFSNGIKPGQASTHAAPVPWLLQLFDGFVSDEAAAAAATAKSLQSCLTLCDPIDGSPSDEKGYVIGNEEEGTGLKLQPRRL